MKENPNQVPELYLDGTFDDLSSLDKIQIWHLLTLDELDLKPEQILEYFLNLQKYICFYDKRSFYI